MIIVIDGYNLLKLIFSGAKNIRDAQRNYFIKLLGEYKRTRGSDIKEIVIVFDAGASVHSIRSIKCGITVVYSGQRQSADDWIKDFVERKKNEDILLVTMDRELISECEKYGACNLCSLEFYEIIKKNKFERDGK